MSEQLILDWGMGVPALFSTFLEEGNEAAVRAVKELKSGDVPLYLWGPTGCGKSHLLQSCAASWAEREQTVVTMDPDQPWREPDWDALDGQAWLLVLDHADRWSALQQHLAFACFVQAVSRGGTVLSAGRTPPVDLPLRDDIRSRLAWGDVVSVKSLSEASVAQLWSQGSKARGMRGADEVLPYVLRHLRRDPGSLMQLLDRLDRYALARQRPLTIPLLREMLEQHD